LASNSEKGRKLKNHLSREFKVERKMDGCTLEERKINREERK
jgi:hypothetical protein